MKGTLSIIKWIIDLCKHGDNATSIKVRSRIQRIKDSDDYILFHKEELHYYLLEKDKKIITSGIVGEDFFVLRETQ